MAVDLDNLDDMIEGLARLGVAAEREVIREARKNLRATVRKYQPKFKKITPIGQTGEMAKSLKIKSRSRRGLSSVQLQWTVPYAGFVNFKKDNKISRWFASDEFLKVKSELDEQGLKDVKDAFKLVFGQYGVEIK